MTREEKRREEKQQRPLNTATPSNQKKFNAILIADSDPLGSVFIVVQRTPSVSNCPQKLSGFESISAPS